MAGYIVFVVCLVACVSALPTKQEKFLPNLPFQYYSKADWDGRPPTSRNLLSLPVPYVVIHHSYIPGACFTAQQCKQAMRSMQAYHQVDQGWTDIGYNFAVGSDGAVYEGRGWRTVGAHAVGYNTQSIGIVLIGDWVSKLIMFVCGSFAVGSDGAVYEGRGWRTVGAHAVGYNTQSIGIVLIGDWVSELPPPRQLQAAKDLIAVGVGLGLISPTYCLIGHRQASATECPGQSLYTDLTSWVRFQAHPSSDLCQ